MTVVCLAADPGIQDELFQGLQGDDRGTSDHCLPRARARRTSGVDAGTAARTLDASGHWCGASCWKPRPATRLHASFYLPGDLP